MITTPDPWSFFDKIYCISIDTRIDRRTEAKKQFSQAGFLDKMEFVLVKKDHDNPEKGIFESHMYCLKKGLQTGAEHILIFEDDIFFKKYQPERLVDAVQFLENNLNWNCFFLGAISSKIAVTDVQSVVKIQYRCLAHAYAVNHHFAELLLQKTWASVPYDDLLRKQCSQYYALSPMVAFQGLATSDNQTVLLDRIRRVFGGLPFIQQMNELFQKHKKLIITAHLFIIMGLIILTMKMY